MSLKNIAKKQKDSSHLQSYNFAKTKEKHLKMEDNMEHTGHKYEGNFVVVTGASSDIGMELDRVFAENGLELLIAAETENITVDLSTYEGVETLYQKIIATKAGKSSGP